MRKFWQGLIFVVAMGFGNGPFLYAQLNRGIIPFNPEENLQDYDYIFMEAVRHKMNGDFQQAAVLLERCIQLNPSAAAPFFQLSEILLNQGDTSDALQFARQAVRLGGENKWYSIHLARVFHVAQQPDSGRMVYQRLMDQFPKDLDIKKNMVSFCLETENFKEALSVLDQLQDSLGYTSDIIMTKYQVLLRLDQKEEALGLLLKAERENPDEALIQGALAEVYTLTGQTDLALQKYLYFLEMEPDHAAGNLSLVSFYMFMKDYQAALSKTREILLNRNMEFQPKLDLLREMSSDSVVLSRYTSTLDTLISTFVSEYPDIAQAIIMRSDFLIRKQDLEKANDFLRIQTAKFKDQYILWSQYAYVLNRLGDFESLKAATTEALQYFGEDLWLYRLKALAEMQTGDYPSAINTLKASLHYVGNVKEDQSGIYELLGESYRQTGDFVHSDDFYQLAIDLDPSNIPAMNNYAYSLSVRGESLSKAESMIKKCLEKEPDNESYLDTAAWISYKKGNIPESLRYIEMVVKEGEEFSPEIMVHYLEILLASGQKKKAKDIFSDLRKNPLFVNSAEFKNAESLMKNGI